MDEHVISNFIEKQFPEIYRVEGPFFVEFLKQYYAWLETDDVSPVYQARRHLENHDIDTTVDEFLIYFKEKYLKNIQLNTATNTKALIKNALDLYRSKGSENAIHLFFDLIFSADSSVYYPGLDVFRASSATWTIPYYLEVTSTPVNRLLVGRAIQGVTSGATAFVEKLVRRRVKGNYVEVLYISAVSGVNPFETGEIIKIVGDTTTPIATFPTIIGSLTTLDVEDGGTGFAKGDIVSLESRTGDGGLALVTGLEIITGTVNFTLKNGGWGYTSNAEVHVSEKVLTLSNVHVVSSTNSTLSDAVIHIEQNIANVQWYNNTAFFGVGDTVYNYYANGLLIGSNKIISAEYGTNTTTNFFLLNTTSGNNYMDPAAPHYYTSGNTANFQVQNAGWVDDSAAGDVVGRSANCIVYCTGNSDVFSLGDLAYQISTNNWVYANSTVVGIDIITPNTFSMNVVINNGLFLTNQDLISSSTNKNVAITSITYDVGLENITGGFRSSNGNYVVDTSTGSQWNGSVERASFGSGADVDVGSLQYPETIQINTDMLSDYANVPLNAVSYGNTLHSANMSNMTIANAINYTSMTLGKIGKLSGQNPGVGYSYPPFIDIKEPLVSSHAKRDFVIRFSSATGVFAIGEQVTQAINGAIGIVKNANTTEVELERLAFEDKWVVGNSNSSYQMVGVTSGHSAYPSEITASEEAVSDHNANDRDGPIGNNAIVTTKVSSSNSAVLTLKVTDSGFQFRDGDEVTFTSKDKERTGSAIASVETMGQGSGFYDTSSGFLSDNKFLYDGEYYQDFSYEIRSPITVERYSDMLKSVLHVSGTRVFSALVKTSDIDSSGNVAISDFVQSDTVIIGGGGGGGNTESMAFRLGGFTYANDNSTVVYLGSADDTATNNFEPLAGMTVDSTGAMILAGTLQTNATSVQFVSKYTSNGDAVVFQTELDDFDSIYSVAANPTDDSIFVVGGVASANASLIAKLDVDGTLLWQKSYTNAGDYITFDDAKVVNNSLYVSGSVSSFALTAKLDPDGSMVWKQMYGDTDFIMTITGYSIVVGANTVATAIAYDNDAYFGVACYGTDGTPVWNTIVGVTAVNGALQPQVVLDADQNVYVGMCDTDIGVRVTKLAAADGTIVWSKKITFSDSPGTFWNWPLASTAFSIQSNGNDIYIFGDIEEYNSTDASAIKLDTDGNVVWSRFVFDGGLNYPAEQFTGIHALIQSNTLYFTAGNMYNARDRFDYASVLRLPVDPDADMQFGNTDIGFSTPFEPIFEPNVLTYSGDAIVAAGAFIHGDGSTPVNITTPVIGVDVDDITITDITDSANVTAWDSSNWTVPNVLTGADQAVGGNGFILIHGTNLPQYGDIEFRASAADDTGVVCVGWDYSSNGSTFSANDTIVTKFALDGSSVLWSQSIRNLTNDDYNVIVDQNNSDIYITGGRSANTVYFYKFNGTGTLQWQRKIANNAYFLVGGITQDANYVYTGLITGDANNQMAFHKLNKNDGTTAAQETIPALGTFGNYIGSMDLANDGDVLVTVMINGGANTPIGNSDVGVLKIANTVSSITWQRVFVTANGIEWPSAIVNDPATGDIYVVGDTEDEPSTDAHLFVTKYNSSGVHQFTRWFQHLTFNGANEQMYSHNFNWNGHGAVILNDHLYVRSNREDNNSDSNNEDSRGGDVVIMKFALDGTPVWSKTLMTGGENDDRSTGISTDGTYIYVTGTLYDSQYAGFVWRLEESGVASGVYGGHHEIRDFPLTESTSHFTLGELAGTFSAPVASTKTNAAATQTVSTTNTPNLTPKSMALPPPS